MADAAVHDPRLWRLLTGDIWRKARRRLRIGVLHPWRFAGPTPERLLVAPPDLRVADPAIAREFYAGRFPLAGRIVASAVTPFSGETADDPFQHELHAFAWLRHFRAAGTELASANARALVSDWMTINGGNLAGVAWAPEVVARRIIAWLQHSPVVLQGSELPFYRAFLRSLAFQVRFLRAMAPEMPDGEERLYARAALVFAALAFPSSPGILARAGRDLAREIDRQILPDGGHFSRNPGVLPDLLADFLALRQLYADQAEPPPPALVNAIDRMFPALRFFAHRDGILARFNGMGPTDTALLAAILGHDETAGSPLMSAPHSGYQRLAVAGVTVIADTGLPPPIAVSREAHAGTLSFEMSSGQDVFVVNAGVNPRGGDEWRQLGRATAAHSTVTFDDRSSARFSHSASSRDLFGAPLVAGPRHVTVERVDGAGARAFRASHDGYGPRLGVIHRRALSVSADGAVLSGIDSFTGSSGPFSRDLVGALRFHLHPSIGVRNGADRHVVLEAMGGDAWAFSVDRLEATVEESIFFADPAGPRKTLQIVADFNPADHPEITWRFERIRRAAS